jgi:hypothetical protein
MDQEVNFMDVVFFEKYCNTIYATCIHEYKEVFQDYKTSVTVFILNLHAIKLYI